MSCQLGCAAEYTVQVVERGSGPPVGDALRFSSLSWGRILDGTSDAEVTIDLAKAPECCDQLAKVRSWRHELLIYRDQDRVWEGPIMNVDARRSQVVLSAQDVTAWLRYRVIHNRLCFAGSCGGGRPDLAYVAEAIIRDALEPDDPRILPYLVVVASGTAGERIYDPNSGPAIDALDELAKIAVDYTAVGRAIVVGGPLTFGQIAQLTCDDWTGDVATVEDGLGTVTRGIVNGDGVVGVAGGIDPYYGLLEQIVNANDVKDKESATAGAQQLLAGANPPPLYVVPPSNGELSPLAPVCINELVPGVLVPVNLECTCRPVSSVMRLTGLQVDFDEQGERVRPTLAPAAVLPPGGLEEVPTHA